MKEAYRRNLIVLNTAIIQAKNLCKTYSTGSEQFHAIRNIDLDIFQGDFTVIMGDSGSGKSTLLYMLSGLDSLTAGEVYFRQQRIDQFFEKELGAFRTQKIGYVYQSSNLVPDLTLFENIALPGYVAGTSKREVKQKALSLMESMNIDGQQKRLPAEVSGGQQQRAAIARAIMNTPDIIFADEPTGSLNYEQGVKVLDILTQMNAKGQSIVMVTHDIKSACRANRIIFIRDGKVGGMLELDPYSPDGLQDRESLIFSYITGRG
ncbi:ABC transporter ATP-binding protein [Paenibacillus sp. JW14]|uniref:ABC transporter ATP-binding protein n=1 Tax=Paenibacillus agri TaxID=2744309 RepID=A0A850EPR8_9BACL|nr:ABC transporter ATP-binding protein [Paenibacillus agri]